MTTTFPDINTPSEAFKQEKAQADEIASRWSDYFVEYIETDRRPFSNRLEIWQAIEEAADALASEYLKGGLDDPRRQDLFKAFVYFAGFQPQCSLSEYMLEIADTYWVTGDSLGFGSTIEIARFMHPAKTWFDLYSIPDSSQVSFDQIVRNKAYETIWFALERVSEIETLTNTEWSPEFSLDEPDLDRELEYLDNKICEALQEIGIRLIEVDGIGIIVFSR